MSLSRRGILSFCLQSISLLIGLMAVVRLAMSQAPPQPTWPTRDPHTPGYVRARELPDASKPPANADGNFVIEPTPPSAVEMSVHEGVPQGTVYEFTMNSADGEYYPGIARERDTFGTPDLTAPAKLVVSTSHRAPYNRRVGV